MNLVIDGKSYTVQKEVGELIHAISLERDELKLSGDRVDYLKRLVDGVQKEVDKHTIEIEGDKCTPSEWTDAWLLCSVIKKEILEAYQS